jgi:RNA polymerase sigma-70 factor (ECF subfamily)
MCIVNDETFLARLGAGEREALAEAWASHRERLLRHVEKKLDRVPVMRRVIDPEDVVQAVYLEAVRDLPHYLARSGTLDLYVWFVGLARRQLGSAYESYLDAKKRNLRGQQALPGDASDLLVDTAPDPCDRAMANEDAERLETCLARLAPRDRQVVRLASLELRPLREVAEHIGISEDAAAQRVSRARRRLKLLLERCELAAG